MLNYRISIAALIQLMNHPEPDERGWRCYRRLGVLSAIVPDYPDEDDIAGRWQTLVACEQQFVLLIDQFRTLQPESFTLTVTGPQELRRDGHRHLTKMDNGVAAVHPLGDYHVHTSDGELQFQQRLVNGRFLLAITRDPEAQVRVLNGWAIEVRSAGRVYQLLHSNRWGRRRPLGPIQTDAAFALAEWSLEAGPSHANVHLLQATQLVQAEQQQLMAQYPVDMLWRGTSVERAPV